MAETWTMKRGTVEQYQFNGPGGAWAIITLDPRGIFQAVSDFGTYSYDGWGHHGCESFKHFLVGLKDADYFISKVCGMDGGRGGPGRAGQIFDYEATIREMRRNICERRLDGDIDRKTAREAWEEMEGLDDPRHDETYWVQSVAGYETLFKVVAGQDHCEVPCCHRLAPLPLRFFNEIFRGQLVPALQRELAPASAPERRA